AAALLSGLDWRLGRFFLQAEDGIRDRNVTGVQTCALPISHDQPDGAVNAGVVAQAGLLDGGLPAGAEGVGLVVLGQGLEQHLAEIGRASRRDSVEISVVARAREQKAARSSCGAVRTVQGLA